MSCVQEVSLNKALDFISAFFSDLRLELLSNDCTNRHRHAYSSVRVTDVTLNLMISAAGWMCAEKSPHIPKPSGKYHITHLLLKHLLAV